MKTPSLVILLRARDFDGSGAGLTRMGGTIRQPYALRRRSVCHDRGCRGPGLRDRNHGHQYGRERLDNDQVQLGGRPAVARTQDGGGNDAAFAITTDEAGNVYVTGIAPADSIS